LERREEREKEGQNGIMEKKEYSKKIKIKLE